MMVNLILIQMICRDSMVSNPKRRRVTCVKCNRKNKLEYYRYIDIYGRSREKESCVELQQKNRDMDNMVSCNNTQDEMKEEKMRTSQKQATCVKSNPKK